MFNANPNSNFVPVPLHHPPVPHHPMDHARRHNLVSVVYDGSKLQEVYGDLWGYHVEKVASEPPEMKLLFALEMGFRVTVNSQIMEALLRQREEERARGTSHKFANTALANEELLTMIAAKLAMEKDEVAVVLEHAPEGVVSIIIAAATNK